MDDEELDDDELEELDDKEELDDEDELDDELDPTDDEVGLLVGVGEGPPGGVFVVPEPGPA